MVSHPYPHSHLCRMVGPESVMLLHGASAVVAEALTTLSKAAGNLVATSEKLSSHDSLLLRGRVASMLDVVVTLQEHSGLLLGVAAALMELSKQGGALVSTLETQQKVGCCCVLWTFISCCF